MFLDLEQALLVIGQVFFILRTKVFSYRTSVFIA